MQTPRPDGLSAPEAALDQVLAVSDVVAAAVVDIDSGLPLAVRSADDRRVDLELTMAVQADLVRMALDTFRAMYRAGPPTELVVSHGERLHHLLRPVPDPFGDRLALAVVVAGPRRSLSRVRRRLRRIAVEALVPRPVPPSSGHAAGAVPGPRPPHAAVSGPPGGPSRPAVAPVRAVPAAPAWHVAGPPPGSSVVACPTAPTPRVRDEERRRPEGPVAPRAIPPPRPRR